MREMRTIRLVAATALAVLFGGCDEGDSGGRFFIVQNQVPSGSCVVSTTRSIYRGEGALDVDLVGASGFAYQLFPLIQNDFPSTGGGGQPEPNRLFVRAFRVRVEAGAGAPAKVVELMDRIAGGEGTRALLEYQQPWAATIDPGGGLLAAGVGVVPTELARQIAGLRVLGDGQTVPINVRVRAVGVRREGEVESQEFVYPIEVCQGCLIANLRPCPYAPTNIGNPCNVAQDTAVDCCQDGTELVCPSIPPASK